MEQALCEKLSSPLAPASTEFKHTSVLIIDDDPVYRILLRDICHKLGIGRIAEAADGQLGLDSLPFTRPDLIVLDVMMPGIDGIEVCRRLRATKEFADTAVLIQTGLMDETKRMAIFQAGANDVVSKPLNLPEFMARMRTHLRQAITLRRLGSFHQRLTNHLITANSLLTAQLPDPHAAAELAERNGFRLSVVRHQHEEIGGDLWYLHEVSPGRLLLILLDPNAPGLAGAINALRIDTALRELTRHHTDPQQLLRALDRVMVESPCGRLFASVTAVVVDRMEKALWYTASGNPYPIFCRGKQVAALVSGGLPLGSGLATLELKHIAMNPGDMLVLHTDGWPARAGDNPLDLIQNALENGQADAETLENNSSHSNDDVTLITLQHTGHS
ncbi:MAG: fused response regulator/phosphatase [Alphaproteobacteria bacterium]|nr:fused response regulator/phosphatase [Alphaproteobacteria bacterium]